MQRLLLQRVLLQVRGLRQDHHARYGEYTGLSITAPLPLKMYRLIYPSQERQKSSVSSLIKWISCNKSSMSTKVTG